MYSPPRPKRGLPSEPSQTLDIPECYSGRGTMFPVTAGHIRRVDRPAAKNGNVGEVEAARAVLEPSRKGAASERRDRLNATVQQVRADPVSPKSPKPGET